MPGSGIAKRWKSLEQGTINCGPGAALGGIFVGRQREIAALQAALDDALSGQGRLVMLVGEPGIGKTRPAPEFATRSSPRPRW